LVSELLGMNEGVQWGWSENTRDIPHGTRMKFVEAMDIDSGSIHHGVYPGWLAEASLSSA
jgi:hypothetical protein